MSTCGMLIKNFLAPAGKEKVPQRRPLQIQSMPDDQIKNAQSLI